MMNKFPISTFVMILCVFNSGVFVTSAKKHRKERKRCPRVCLREISKQVNRLKAEIEELKKRSSKTIEGPVGPAGPRGLKGDVGVAGPRGFRGQKGEPGAYGIQQGTSRYVFPNLPVCTDDEFVTSNGKALFCIKFDTKTLTAKGSSKSRQPHPPVAPNPTFPPGFKDRMAVFERKSMIQRIEGDSWDIGVFKHESNYYFCSSLLGKAFTVFKWLSNKFFQLQRFPIRDARNWKTFVRNGHLFLAIASNSNRYSPVYKFLNEVDIVEYQKIPVEGVFDVQPFETDNGFFLVYASIHGPTSTIFRWLEDKKVFIKHQIVPAYGTDVESFKIGEKYLIAFVAMENGPYISLYELSKEGNFTKYGSIRDDEKAYSMHHFVIGAEHYLAVARFSNKPSVIFKWDGGTFRPHQTIDSCWARGFASITTPLLGGVQTYLAVVNSKCNSAIYALDAASHRFIKLQEMQSRLTRDMDFFKMDSHVYLVVSAVQETNIYRGTIKRRS